MCKTWVSISVTPASQLLPTELSSFKTFIHKLFVTTTHPQGRAGDIRGNNALVICNHGPPHPRGIAGTLTFVLQIPAKSPALRGHPVGKTTALPPPPPHSLLCFHCTAMFAYIRQTPGIYSALQGQSKSKNTAKLLPPPPQGVGAVVTND